MVETPTLKDDRVHLLKSAPKNIRDHKQAQTHHQFDCPPCFYLFDCPARKSECKGVARHIKRPMIGSF